MNAERLAVVRGWADTRAALGRWNAAPSQVLVPWGLISLATALALLTATWAVARLSVADPTPWAFPGITTPADAGAYLGILLRNGLVLALHALACVAGFLARSSLPEVAEGYSGAVRWVHRKAGPAALAFVALATAFSLVTQAAALGAGTATLAAQLGMSPAALLVLLSPHALPELVALFLPLAAWIVAGRAGRWDELLAATVVTVAIAVPVLLATAAIEVWVTPALLGHYTS